MGTNIQSLGLDPKKFKVELIQTLDELFDRHGEKLNTRALLPNGLTFRQSLFVEFFIATEGRAEEAARLAGYQNENESSFKTYVNQMLTKEPVARAIMTRMKEVMVMTSLTPETVISQLVRIATANIKDVTKWEGDTVSLKASEEIDASIADAISEVSMTRAAGGHKSVRVKMHNKMDALKELSKLMQLYADSTIHVKVTDNDSMSDEELIAKYEKELKRSGMLVEP